MLGGGGPVCSPPGHGARACLDSGGAGSAGRGRGRGFLVQAVSLEGFLVNRPDPGPWGRLRQHGSSGRERPEA